MKTNRIIISLCTVVALCAQAALAQQSDSTQNPNSTQSSTRHHDKDSTSGSYSATTGTSSSTMGGNCMAFSKLKGTAIKSTSGETLGKLEDVVLDPQGKATFAIISKGGVLSVGDKHLPVPWQALTFDSQKQITLNVDKEKLRTAPTVKSDYSDLEDSSSTTTIYNFYGVQPSGVGSSVETPGGTSSSSSKFRSGSGTLNSGSSSSSSGTTTPSDTTTPKR
jgi:uncharacterized protein YrrD